MNNTGSQDKGFYTILLLGRLSYVLLYYIHPPTERYVILFRLRDLA